MYIKSIVPHNIGAQKYYAGMKMFSPNSNHARIFKYSGYFAFATKYGKWNEREVGKIKVD